MISARKCRNHFILFLIFGYILVAYFMRLKQRKPALDHVVVHIDLKGAPPKMQYLISLLKIFKLYGATAILMEYEDMFPYEENIKQLRSVHAYDKDELMDFLFQAKEYGLEVIPFIQTFRNLEFILEHKEFHHFKDNPYMLNNNPVIHDLLTQIIHFHESVTPLKYLHIGCHETNQTNDCILCRKRNLPYVKMFQHHVRKIVEIALSTSKNTGLKILLWGDMLKEHKIEFLDPQNFDVEPIVWHYGSTVEEARYDIEYYQKNYDGFWIASAFKGADEPFNFFPDLSKRFLNNYKWLQLLQKYTGVRYKFKGIILTGSSRHYHDGPLCELMVPAIPSLLVSLFLIKIYKTETYADFSQNWKDFFGKKFIYDIKGNLACDLNYFFLANDELHCTYPGYKLNEAFTGLSYVNSSISKFVSEFYRVSKLSQNSSLIIHTANIIHQVQQLKSELDSIKLETWETMTDFYPDFAAREYIEQKTKHLSRELNLILSDLYSNNKTAGIRRS